MSELHSNYHNESGIVATGVSEDDNANQQEGLAHIVHQLEELKTLLGNRSGEHYCFTSLVIAII